MSKKQVNWIINALQYAVLSYCTNPVYWELIAACVVFGVLQKRNGSWAECLLYYQYGVPYIFEESIDLAKTMIWLCPHMLLSIFFGQQMEREMGFSRLQIHRYGSRNQWWIRELMRIWLAVILYYVAIYAGIIGVSSIFAVIRTGTLSGFSYMISSSYVQMLIRDVLGMGVLLTMQGSAQLCLKKASVGIAIFFISVFFSVFCPIESLAKYTIGSWMMVRRAGLLSPEYGYNWLHVLMGAGTVFLVAVLSTNFCLRIQRNHW